MNKRHFKKWLCIGLSLLLLFVFATPSHASYQALSLNGSGFCSIDSASQAGLNMGLSDFMLEVRVKSSASGVHQYIITKWIANSAYYVRITQTSGLLRAMIGDGLNTAIVETSTTINDGIWHYVVFVVDRSSATGLKLYIDGSEVAYNTQEDPTSVLNIDNANAFYIGYGYTGLTDEARIWNFGYGGLPSDWEDYITWRAAGRNVFKDISEYNSGSWNGYADADRTDATGEKITDPGIESWTDDTPDDWIEGGESAGVRDITDEQVEIHGGSHAVKLLATNNNGTYFRIHQLITLVANKAYELKGWTYFAARTAGTGNLQLWNATDTTVVQGSIAGAEGAYTFHGMVGIPTIADNRVYCYLLSETTTGTIYFDDISVKRVGLVGHWKFDGDYTDETSNSNTLTAGGTGNAFPGYTLKKVKIISPFSVK